MNYTVTLVRASQVKGLPDKELTLPTDETTLTKFTKNGSKKYSSWSKVVVLGEKGENPQPTADDLKYLVGMQLTLLHDCYGVNKVARYLVDNDCSIEDALILAGLSGDLTDETIESSIRTLELLKETKEDAHDSRNIN